MATIVPTVLASDPAEYATMLSRAESLSKRVHVDVCDGVFASGKTIGLAQVHVADDTHLDLHLMLKDSGTEMETALSLHPHLIIIHAESEGDLLGLITRIASLGIKTGIAVLPSTPLDAVRPLIEKVDHVLIFTGTLGQNGGQFQADQLERAAAIRQIKSKIEISVDGGVSDANAAAIVGAGVDVLYAGGFLQNAENPAAAYGSINKTIEVYS